VGIEAREVIPFGGVAGVAQKNFVLVKRQSHEEEYRLVSKEPAWELKKRSKEEKKEKTSS